MGLSQNAAQRRAASSILHALAPWLAPVVVLLWGWRVWDLARQVPDYGDVLEVLWGIKWFGDRLFSGQGVGFFDGVFHPVGWQIGTFAHSPALLILLLPLYKLGGAAFAFNMGTLAAFLLGYAGMFILARRWGFDRLLATLVAVLFGFCYMRWLRTGGHLNQLIGSSLIPWLLWALDRAWAERDRFLRWFAAAGAIWGVAAAISFYFLWLGAVAVGGYALVHVLNDRAAWRKTLSGVALAGVVMLALSGPVLWVYFRSLRLADVPTTDIGWISEWGASLNTLPAPSPLHPIPWLRKLNGLIYRGPVNEASAVMLGAAAMLLATVGLWRVRRERAWRPVLVVTALGLVFALGYVLRWNGKPVELPVFRWTNAGIWLVGRLLKPALFFTLRPYGPFARGAPLPGLWLAALLPFWEGARTLSRFAFVALPGFYLLVGKGVQGFRRPVLRVALAALLLVEFLPYPTGVYPADPAPHPAFAWLRTNTRASDGIVDLSPADSGRLELMFGGEVLWATQYHQRSTAAGAGSVWPRRTYQLREWLILHPHPGRDPGLAQTLRDNQVRYVLLHMQGPYAAVALKELRKAPDMRLIDCFDRAQARTAWPYAICVFEINEG